MDLIKSFIKEGKKYNKNDLIKKLGIYDNFELNELLTNLLKKKILLIEQDFDIDPESYWDTSDIGEKNTNYYFKFVGIVCFNKHVIYVYPKYITQNKKPISEMIQILKVIEKYNSKFKTILSDYQNDYLSASSSIISLFLELIDNYFSNGIYQNREQKIEMNGAGNIHWQRTIDLTNPIISNCQPIYIDNYTVCSQSNKLDYFSTLHECILTECSNQLETLGLNNIFGLPRLELSEAPLDFFGDRMTILSRLDNEASIQFEDNKLNILKLMTAFVKESEKVSAGKKGLALFGTNSFHVIWENVCSEVFSNQRDKALCDIDPPLVKDYSSIAPFCKTTILKDIICKPIWEWNGAKYSSKTLLPDYLCFSTETTDKAFYILDAKYYTPQEINSELKNMPGVEDITKQYLYQIAFLKFLEKLDSKYIVKNYFVMPTDKEEITAPGKVEIDLWKNIGCTLDPIQIKQIPAPMLFTAYLSGSELSLDLLE